MKIVSIRAECPFCADRVWDLQDLCTAYARTGLAILRFLYRVSAL